VIEKVGSQLPMDGKQKDEKDNGLLGVQSRVMVASSI
jgi:hypothetical protein